MCSIITHPIVPISFAAMFPNVNISRPVIFAGAICSVIPDLDVVGFRFGIKYADMLGHRGLTHSIFFAVLLGGVIAYSLRDRIGRAPLITFAFLALSTLSHGILDAFTNGGLGVAFFSPFQNKRYFFPWRPILVSPIGVANFFSETGLRVLWSELRWVWLPCGILYGLSRALTWRK
jgi:inner membrane protein